MRIHSQLTPRFALELRDPRGNLGWKIYLRKVDQSLSDSVADLYNVNWYDVWNKALDLVGQS